MLARCEGKISLGHQVSCGERRANVVACCPVPLPSSSTSPVAPAHESGDRRPDGLVIALKGRGIQPAFARGVCAGLAELDDELRHGCNALMAE